MMIEFVAAGPQDQPLRTRLQGGYSVRARRRGAPTMPARPVPGSNVLAGPGTLTS
jgi:hypothetical protein